MPFTVVRSNWFRFIEKKPSGTGTWKKSGRSDCEPGMRLLITILLIFVINAAPAGVDLAGLVEGENAAHASYSPLVNVVSVGAAKISPASSSAPMRKIGWFRTLMASIRN